MADPLVLRGVSRAYRSGDALLQVLDSADLTLRAGEIVALVAPSGTGKSTLLHLAGLLERPDSGAVLVDGRDAGSLDDAARTAIRRDRIGFVYQAHHLLAEFTALENVVLPQMVAGRGRRPPGPRCSDPPRPSRHAQVCGKPFEPALQGRGRGRRMIKTRQKGQGHVGAEPQRLAARIGAAADDHRPARTQHDRRGAG